MAKSIGTGLLSALFFSLTFILNGEMGLQGGHWLWSASLRFIVMFMLLSLYLYKKNHLKKVWLYTRKDIFSWFLWSHIGFGVFYSMLTYASTYTEPWLVASTWQLTIIAGILLSPFIDGKTSRSSGKALPLLPLLFGMIILVGVFLVNQPTSSQRSMGDILKSILPILIAAFAYPLGNRKTMALSGDHLTALERVYAMSLYSMPLWLLLSTIGLSNKIIPTLSQVTQSFVVAICSGIIATYLFFKACQSERFDQRNLAVIESTQSFEIVFTILLGALFFNHQPPSPSASLGLIIIVLGMVLNSFSPMISQTGRKVKLAVTKSNS